MIDGSGNGDNSGLNDPTVIPTPSDKVVRQYAYVGATDIDIADRFLMEESALRADFADSLRSARALRRIAIRSMQMEVARKHNAPMLTWLGRNELGQSLNPSTPGEPEPEIAG